jgi:hypothetical protein
MAGRTPPEAVNNFLAPLDRSLSCLTTRGINVKGGYHSADSPHPLTLHQNPSPIGRDKRFAIKAIQHYRIVEYDGPRGPWKVSTVAYYYTREDAGGAELLGFHWHPNERSAVIHPHLHVYPATGISHPDLLKRHIPTGRVSLEAVFRYAIVELNVEPLRDDWVEVLDASQEAFEQWRTWG